MLVLSISTMDGRVNGRGGVQIGVRGPTSTDVDERGKHGASSVRACGAIPDRLSIVTT